MEEYTVLLADCFIGDCKTLVFVAEIFWRLAIPYTYSSEHWILFKQSLIENRWTTKPRVLAYMLQVATRCIMNYIVSTSKF